MDVSERLSTTDFESLLRHINSRLGMTLPETNYSLVDTYVGQRLKERGETIASFLMALSRDESEFADFIDAVTINETYFFREEKQFRLLESTVFPEFESRNRTPRIWSSSCSTGEEAVSLLLLARNYFGSSSDIQVFASDISRRALEIFESGKYRKNSFRQDGRGYHKLVYDAADEIENGWQLGHSVVSKIGKSVVNVDTLSNDSVPGLFDLIFLRNTLIYFDLEKRERIISSLIRFLAEDGYLFLSSTEMPLVSHQDLGLVESNGVYCFRKKSEKDKSSGQVVTEMILDSAHSSPKESRGKEQRIESGNDEEVDTRKIFEYANLRLNNPIFSVPGEEFVLSQILLGIVYAINSSNIEEAVKLLGQFRDRAGSHEVTYYLHGYLAEIDESLEKAGSCYERALRRNSAFWPARFKHAMLLRKQSRVSAALRELRVCLNDINGYVADGRYDYQFLLDGFNGKYFAQICEIMIRNLNMQGKSDGIG